MGGKGVQRNWTCFAELEEVIPVVRMKKQDSAPAGLIVCSAAWSACSTCRTETPQRRLQEA